VSANARTKVFFATSPEDARALARHVAPELAEHDLAHLAAYQAAARLVVYGAERPAFTLRTRSAPPAVPGRAESIRASSAAAYGRTKAQRRAEAITRDGRGRSPGRSPGTSAGRSAGSFHLPARLGANRPVEVPSTPADATPDSGAGRR